MTRAQGKHREFSLNEAWQPCSGINSHWVEIMITCIYEIKTGNLTVYYNCIVVDRNLVRLTSGDDSVTVYSFVRSFEEITENYKKVQ